MSLISFVGGSFGSNFMFEVDVTWVALMHAGPVDMFVIIGDDDLPDLDSLLLAI